MTTNRYRWFQFNGIVCYGEIAGSAFFDGILYFVMHYWYDPDGDPPRKPYTVVEPHELEKIAKWPGSMRKAEFVL